jgi:hypothetical protein
MLWDTFSLIPPRTSFDRHWILFVLSLILTNILCNLDFGRRVVPMIGLDLLVLTCRSVSKDNQLRIRRLRLVRRQCFRYHRDVPMQWGDRIRQGVNCDIIMLQSVLDRSVVGQPKRNQLLSFMVTDLESIFEGSENLDCSCRIALEMMSHRQCSPILSNHWFQLQQSQPRFLPSTPIFLMRNTV